MLCLLFPTGMPLQSHEQSDRQQQTVTTDEKVYSREEVDTPAKVTHNEPPDLPLMESDRMFYGKVRVRAVFRATGKVSDIQVLDSVPDEVKKTSIKAVQKTKFKPAIKDGRPVSQYAIFVHSYGVDID
jgi:TonB family protein